MPRREVAAAVVALTMAAAACGGSSVRVSGGSTTATGMAVGVEQFAAPTPLADGYVVNAGSALLGRLLPRVLEPPAPVRARYPEIYRDSGRDSGWEGYLVVTGEPLDVVRGYLDQAESSGLRIQTPASCEGKGRTLICAGEALDMGESSVPIRSFSVSIGAAQDVDGNDITLGVISLYNSGAEAAPEAGNWPPALAVRVPPTGEVEGNVALKSLFDLETGFGSLDVRLPEGASLALPPVSFLGSGGRSVLVMQRLDRAGGAAALEWYRQEATRLGWRVNEPYRATVGTAEVARVRHWEAGDGGIMTIVVASPAERDGLLVARIEKQG